MSTPLSLPEADYSMQFEIARAEKRSKVRASAIPAYVLPSADLDSCEFPKCPPDPNVFIRRPISGVLRPESLQPFSDDLSRPFPFEQRRAPLAIREHQYRPSPLPSPVAISPTQAPEEALHPASTIRAGRPSPLPSPNKLKSRMGHLRSGWGVKEPQGGKGTGSGSPQLLFSGFSSGDLPPPAPRRVVTEERRKATGSPRGGVASRSPRKWGGILKPQNGEQGGGVRSRLSKQGYNNERLMRMGRESGPMPSSSSSDASLSSIAKGMPGLLSSDSSLSSVSISSLPTGDLDSDQMRRTCYAAHKVRTSEALEAGGGAEAGAGGGLGFYEAGGRGKGKKSVMGRTEYQQLHGLVDMDERREVGVGMGVRRDGARDESEMSLHVWAGGGGHGSVVAPMGVAVTGGRRSLRPSVPLRKIQLPSHGDWPGEWRGQWESVPVPQSAGLEEYISVFEDARPSSAPHAGSRSKPAFENRNEERVQSSGAKESWRRGFTHRRQKRPMLKWFRHIFSG